MSAILGTISKFAIPVGAAVSFLQYSMYDGTYCDKLISRCSLQSSCNNNRSDHTPRREGKPGHRGNTFSIATNTATQAAFFLPFFDACSPRRGNVISKAMANNGQGQRELSCCCARVTLGTLFFFLQRAFTNSPDAKSAHMTEWIGSPMNHSFLFPFLPATPSTFSFLLAFLSCSQERYSTFFFAFFVPSQQLVRKG